jgi:molybdopterin converting factor subunit 1
MKVKAKLFAILRERAGTAEIMKELQDGSTVGDLWRALQNDYPKLNVRGIRLLYAVNQSYVTPEEKLNNNDEVAFIPPVSGGSNRPIRGE